MQDLLTQVEPLIPALRRYARALLRDAALADDLVQDCLERVVTRWGQRRGDDDTRQWVFAILHNLAVDTMRQQARRGPHVALDDVDERQFAAPAPQEAPLHGDDIVRALDTLPEEQRSVLLLVSVEDLSYADTARTLGIPLGTVMSRLSRARAALQRVLDGAPGRTAMAPRAPTLRRMK